MNPQERIGYGLQPSIGIHIRIGKAYRFKTSKLGPLFESFVSNPNLKHSKIAKYEKLRNRLSILIV